MRDTDVFASCNGETVDYVLSSSIVSLFSGSGQTRLQHRRQEAENRSHRFQAPHPQRGGHALVPAESECRRGSRIVFTDLKTLDELTRLCWKSWQGRDGDHFNTHLTICKGSRNLFLKNASTYLNVSGLMEHFKTLKLILVTKYVRPRPQWMPSYTMSSWLLNNSCFELAAEMLLSKWNWPCCFIVLCWNAVHNKLIFVCFVSLSVWRYHPAWKVKDHHLILFVTNKMEKMTPCLVFSLLF